MLNFKELFSIILLAVNLAKGQYISASQNFQDDEFFDDPSQQLSERSLNFLNVQLPQGNPDHQPVVHLKPFYMPIPLKEAYASPLSYQAFQPNFMNYMPQQSMPTYQQTNPNNFLYSNINVLPSKYPWSFTPNKVSHIEYPNYIVAPPKPAFVKNPAPQYPQHFNYTHSILKLLPQLLNEPTFYNSPKPQQEIFGVENDSIEQFRGNKPNTIETNVKPIAQEPSIAIIPDATLFSTDEFKKPIKTTKQPTEADIFLLNLLQKLNSRKRVQERLGAVYLKDTFLNRK